MRLIACALVLALAASAPAAAGPDRTSEQAQQTPARVAAERFVAALNDDGSTQDFVASSFSELSLGREPAAERARQLDRLKALSGGFDVLEWKPQAQE